MLKIREHGIQSRERSRVYTKRPICDSDGKSFGSVRLFDCYAAFLILVYGFAVAFLMFCLEKNLLKWKLHKMCIKKMQSCNQLIED